MARAAATLSLLLLAASLAGCLGPGAGPDPSPTGEGGPGIPAPAEPGDPRPGPLRANESTPREAEPEVAEPAPEAAPADDHVVVAVLDTGINPYHAAFRSAAPDAAVHPGERIAGYPANTTALPVSLNASTYAEAVEADADAWAGAEPGKLYWFPGTRVVGAISLIREFCVPDPCDGDAAPILDPHGHGTATAGLVANASPNASIVMVQTNSQGLADALQWAAEQPWIDVVSLSWGSVGNVPAGQVPERLDLWTTVRDASLAATKAGKLVVFGAGNEPTSTTTDEFSGPPWVISVGGADPDGRGEVVEASKHPDVVADYYQPVARPDSVDGAQDRTGTSLAAPTVAGTLAEAIYQVRRQLGHQGGITDGALAVGDAGAGPVADGRVTAGEVRTALNRTAEYWSSTDFEPSNASSPRVLPINPAAPWLQMGWGYVHPGLSGAIAAELLGAGAAPEKPAEAAAYMQGVYALRAAQWA